MASSDSGTPPLPTSTPLSQKKENVMPINSKIAELTESRTELLNRIQSLKQIFMADAKTKGLNPGFAATLYAELNCYSESQDLQGWRSKLDTQVKIYREELSDLKQTLNVEVDQLKSEFQELRTTLQQQQEDVAASLKNLQLQDVSGEVKEAEAPKVDDSNEKLDALANGENGKESEN